MPSAAPPPLALTRALLVPQKYSGKKFFKAFTAVKRWAETEYAPMDFVVRRLAPRAPAHSLTQPAQNPKTGKVERTQAHAVL